MNRAAIAIAMLVTLCSAALADTREDVLSGIARCGTLADDRAWLSCIYGAAQPMRGRLGLPPAPASQTSLVPAASAEMPQSLPTAQPKESDGFFSYVLGGDAIVSGMKLAAYRFDAKGFFTITLANGQVWQQQDGPPAHWKEPASRYLASISKGAVGSFNLTIAGEDVRYDARYKVVRIR